MRSGRHAFGPSEPPLNLIGGYAFPDAPDIGLRPKQTAPIEALVPDAVRPGMWRVRRPDGTLTDMMNLARAKDAALSTAKAGNAAQEPNRTIEAQKPLRHSDYEEAPEEPLPVPSGPYGISPAIVGITGMTGPVG
jgi:hypothetical protein